MLSYHVVFSSGVPLQVGVSNIQSLCACQLWHLSSQRETAFSYLHGAALVSTHI